MLDLIIRNAALPDGRGGLDIGVSGGRIVAIEPGIAGESGDPIEAIRLKAHRLAVVRRGKVIARSQPRLTHLALEGRPAIVDASLYAPPLDRG
jgi:hypothetical protein